MAKSLRLLAVSLMGIALGTSSTVWAETPAVERALPYPTKNTPKPTDLGALTARPAAPITVTVALKMPKLDEAESLLKSINAPGDTNYHKFLTTEEFNTRFAPKDADFAKVASSLAKYGLSAEKKGATTLSVTGSAANIERAFSVSLHSYQVAAQGKVAGYTYRAPVGRATVPAEISSSVAGVIGLDTRPQFHPMHVTAPKVAARAKAKNDLPGNPLGYWTVTDFANYYDVTPLYKHGLGGGRTIGIMTLASFTKSDAYAYWSAIGLSVPSDRITSIHVDGGAGPISDEGGSDETTLDVEQSGGIAPNSNILVYEAPNTSQGFVDLFAAAIEANIAQSLSISWGSWEWFDNVDNSPVSDPIGGETTSTTAAVHQLLVRAAIQGQAVFTAAGDEGAYDLNRGCPLPDCNPTLSVDYPASDTAITAAGGTTLPGQQIYCLDQECTQLYSLTVKNERAWSWDYLAGLCNALELDPISCGIFPGGAGGGGVSISFPVPAYQVGLPGVRTSQPNQFFIADGELIYALPSKYAGRNVPDISFNADPDTGYLLYYTSSSGGGGGFYAYGGGTSFVAPQLAGVSALLSQSLGYKRLGLLNFPLYSLALSGQAYSGPTPPIKAIAYGDNNFYYGSDHYNPAVGLGVLDVANFAQVLKTLY